MKSAFQKVRFRPLTKGSGREFLALCRTIKGFEKRYNIGAKSSAEEQQYLRTVKARTTDPAADLCTGKVNRKASSILTAEP